MEMVEAIGPGDVLAAEADGARGSAEAALLKRRAAALLSDIREELGGADAFTRDDLLNMPSWFLLLSVIVAPKSECDLRGRFA